ncbi:hypothetical protein Pan44_10550 [Caulifigura coniformis]|uniref:RapA2 cadherin-like domain-containing protein n=1 Tax=Caulifigura coniformis TaxID=2527983 RepID=A0A517SA85_9PLAN|nr:Ig-like domain-containing protein [Caulifigura coniformis]QDT53040.1 hypothetical protein Pan44_10550 [Caulifigura coniformis]
MASRIGGRDRRGPEVLESRLLLAAVTATLTDSLPVGGDTDADGVVDPGETITYTATITETSGSAATNVSFSVDLDPNTTLVANSVRITPIALDDAYSLVGNTPLTVNVAAGLLANDIDIDSTTPFSNVGLSAVAASVTDIGGTAGVSGSLVVNANGSFTYTPGTGATGTDIFSYRIVDPHNLQNVTVGVVTFTITDPVWYVDSAYGGANGASDGSFLKPFTSLAPLNDTSLPLDGDADAPGSTIFVYESGANYTTGIQLENNQKLIGESTGLTVNGMSLGGSGANPVIVNTAGNDVTLASGNTLRGINIGTASDAVGSGLAGFNIGTLSVSNVSIVTAGEDAIGIGNGTFAAGSAFTSVSASGLGGISLNSMHGGVDLGTGTLSGSGIVFNVNGGTLSATYSGNITHTTINATVSIINHSSGTITFQSGSINITGGAGLQFANADGSYDFNGTNTLNGGDAGIDILNGSAGSFTFSANTAITNPSGVGFNMLNSNGSVSYAGAIAKNSAGRAVSIDNHDGANNVTFSGNISSTGTSGGILVQNNAAGTVTFSGASKTLNTGANAAVSLLNNTGSTINFTGGGLDIDTTSGAGFAATGGGTVTVQGTGNSITSTSATALNVDNTTIGAGGLVFHAISAGNASAAADPASGIILNTTGATAGLTVTGDGNTSVGGNNSGGTIQNTTSHGISLTNTRSPSFTNVNIQGTLGHGVNGTGVTNFTFANSKVNNAGDASGENSINFDPDSGTANVTFLSNVSGVVSITNNQITNTEADGVRIVNGFGTISNLVITGNQLGDTGDVATPGSAILVQAKAVAVGNAASITRADLNNNTITDFRAGAGFVIQAVSTDATNSALVSLGTPGSATNVINVTGNLMNGGNGGIGNQPDRFITAGISGTAAANFNVSNNGTLANPIRNIDGVVIELQVDGHSTYTATVNNNVIAANNAVGSAGIAIGADADGFAGTTDDAFMIVTVSNNNISQTDGPGIFALARGESTARLDVHILNNTVAAPTATSSARAGIRVDSGSAMSIDTTVNLEISGNTTGGSTNTATSTTSPGINLRKQGTSVTINEFNIKGMPDPAPLGEASPAIENYVNSQNTSTSGTFGVGGTALLSATSGFTNNTPAGFLMFAYALEEAPPQPNVEEPTSSPIDDPINVEPVVIVEEHGPSPTAVNVPEQAVPPVITFDDGVLSQIELDALVDAAIERWIAAGLTDEQRDYLESVTVTVASMPGWYLGSASPGVVTIDSDAAGNGWFIDQTPLDDSEFSSNGSATRLAATAGSDAADDVDLLTTLMHEFGHQLGLPDYYSADQRNNLMFDYLTVGERRLPTAAQADGYVTGSVAHEAFMFGPLNLGTLPANKAVQVIFQATVNTPLPAGLAPTISAQGTVSGTNFTTVNTDDPDIAGPANPTTTTLDSLTIGSQVWIETGGNSTFDVTDTKPNGVTVKLYVDDGDGVLDAGDGAAIATTTTANIGGTDGRYQFTGLLPGNYIIEVASGGPLAGLASLAGAPDPDNNVDNDDNGAPVAGFGFASAPITLAYNTEPTTDGDADADTNLTVDFGFIANQNPVATDDNFTAAEDGPTVTGNLITGNNGNGVDSDADVGNVLSIASIDIPGVGTGLAVGVEHEFASGATILVNADGSFTFNPANAYQGLDDTETTPETFTYTLSDGVGGTDTATVTVTVSGDDDDPVATDNDVTTNEDTSLTGNVITDNNGHGVDSDADIETLTVTSITVDGDVLAVGVLHTLDSGATLIVNSDGSYTYNPNGAFDGLDVGESDTEVFTYNLSDGDGAADTATVTITITGLNDAPVASDDDISVAEFSTVSGNLITGINGNGPDTDPDVETLTITEVNGLAASVGTQITLASGALLTVNANGTFTYDPNGAFDPPPGGSETDSFTYTLSDGTVVDQANVEITITGIGPRGNIVATFRRDKATLSNTDNLPLDVDIVFLAGAVRFVGRNGTTINGVSVLEIPGIDSIGGRLGSSEDTVNVTGDADLFSLDLRAGDNAIKFEDFSSRRTVTATGRLGGLDFDAIDSQFYRLAVNTGNFADSVSLQNIDVTSTTSIRLYAGLHDVTIDDSTFGNTFTLSSTGPNTTLDIEAGAPNLAGTSFLGNFTVTTGSSAVINISPLLTSDQTTFSKLFTITAKTPNAQLIDANAIYSKPKKLKNVTDL